MSERKRVGDGAIDRMLAAAVVNEGFRRQFTTASDKKKLEQLKYEDRRFYVPYRVAFKLVEIIASHSGDFEEIATEIARQREQRQPLTAANIFPHQL